MPRPTQVTSPPRRRLPADAGTSMPFVLLCWLIGAMMAFGGIAASDAFLQQAEVQNTCDGAALAAANDTSGARAYGGAGSGRALPLDPVTARAAVADYLADGGTDLDSWDVVVAGDEVTVTCRRTVQIAFGWLFLAGRGLDRTAVASAQAPVA